MDKRGTSVRLLGAIPDIFDEVVSWGNGARLAIASRTDEPSWAREILGKFRSSSGASLESLLDPDLVEMYKGSKKDHSENIRKKSGVDFSQMIFFDDDPVKIRDVASIGVISVLTPEGVTRQAFGEGLSAFAEARGEGGMFGT